MGPVCIFLLVVSAALSVDAFGGPPRPPYNRPQYNYRPGYNQYNSGAQYNKGNYGYQSKRYSNKGLSVLPPCTTGSTRLEIGVVGPDGTCMPDICVYVTDKSSSTTVTTNSYGLAAVNVKGCTARVSVVNPQYEAKVLDIDLESCEDGKQKVVVSLTKTCNFNIIFQYYGYNSDDIDSVDIPSAHLLNYEYTTSSGAAGFGTTVGGCYTAPTCIYVDTSNQYESLKISVSKSSGGNSFNVLEVYNNMLDVNDDDTVYGARVTIPSAFVGIEPEDILFYVYINVWFQKYFQGCDNIICLDSVSLSFVDGVSVDSVSSSSIIMADPAMNLKPMGFAVQKNPIRAIDGATVTGRDLLICLPLASDDEDVTFPANLEGGAAFVDFNGKVTTNEVDNDVDFNGSGDGDVFMPFCVCEGDLKKVMKVPSYKVIADDCPSTACEFYEVCPCTPAVAPTCTT